MNTRQYLLYTLQMINHWSIQRHWHELRNGASLDNEKPAAIPAAGFLWLGERAEGQGRTADTRIFSPLLYH